MFSMSSESRAKPRFKSGIIVAMSLIAIAYSVLPGQAAPLDIDANSGIINKNSYFIINKAYPHARLAQWGTLFQSMGTYELSVNADQLWQLEAHPNYPGYYYIKNCHYDGYRIGKSNGLNTALGVWSGKYNNDQLWKFVHEGDGYYRIYNKVYPNAKLAKWGSADTWMGTYEGANYDDQLWKLKPRYEVEIEDVVIWSTDNRQGVKDFSESIKVIQGLTRTHSETLSVTKGFTLTLEAGITGSDANAGVKTEFKNEITRSVTSSEESSWKRESTINFTAPAGKNYRVKQKIAKFTSDLSQDNCELRSSYTIEVSDQDFTD